jgi:hypothetical protein
MSAPKHSLFIREWTNESSEGLGFSHFYMLDTL